MRLHGAGFPMVIAGAFRQACRAAALLAVLGAGAAFAQNAGADEGSHVFMQNGCFACHGEMGFGGAGPRFRDDPFLGITDYVVAQILLGRGIMPSFANKLSDQQIAAVASYIRNSWGNHFGDVKPQQVAQVRQTIQHEYDLMGSSGPNPGPSNLPAPQQK
jgi:mono/diheme cytochrome c family protein